MKTFTWPGQTHRDHIVDYHENTYLTGWLLGCPNCGELIAASPSQCVHEVNDVQVSGRFYAKLSIICQHCSCHLSELWSIN